MDIQSCSAGLRRQGSRFSYLLIKVTALVFRDSGLGYSMYFALIIASSCASYLSVVLRQLGGWGYPRAGGRMAVNGQCNANIWATRTPQLPLL